MKCYGPLNSKINLSFDLPKSTNPPQKDIIIMIIIIITVTITITVIIIRRRRRRKTSKGSTIKTPERKYNIRRTKALLK